MADGLANFEGNCKPISHSPLTLLDLASMRVALNILREKFNEVDQSKINPDEKISHAYSNVNFPPIKFTEIEVNTEILTQVPYKIKKMINFWIYPIARKLDLWIKDFEYISYGHIYSRFDLVVFGGVGNIHFKHTIANFLQDDSLDALTKFKMACVHCLEEEIDVLWPLVKCSKDLVDLTFERHPMLYYWICRKRNQMTMFPWPVNTLSIEYYMIRNCRNKSIHLAVEHFLTSSNLTDQLEVIDELFRCGGIWKSAPHLLLNFDAPLQRRLLNKFTTRIFLDFVSNYYQPIEYVVQCWLYIRHDTNKTNFYKLIKDLIYFRSLDFNFKEEVFKFIYVEIVLSEIWYNSSPDQKSFTNLHFSDISDDLAKSEHTLPGLNRDIRFLLSMLSDLDAHSRNTFWVEKWPQWIIGVPPSQFEELMKLCLTNIEAVEDFKRTLPDTEVFQNYHDMLVCEGYHTELNEFLIELYSDPYEVLTIKRTLLGNGQRLFLRPHRQLDAYARYIDTTFSNNTLAEEFKHQLIISDEVFEFLNDELEKCDEFDEVKRSVLLFLSSKKEEEFKKKVLNYFCNKITNGRNLSFNKDYWRKVLMWCSNKDELQFEDFMESLPIHDIFEKHLRKMLDNPTQNSIHDFKSFFTWYFKLNSAYEKFVREKIRYYEAMEISDIRRIFGVDKRKVMILLKKELTRR